MYYVPDSEDQKVGKCREVLFRAVPVCRFFREILSIAVSACVCLLFGVSLCTFVSLFR